MAAVQGDAGREGRAEARRHEMIRDSGSQGEGLALYPERSHGAGEVGPGSALGLVRSTLLNARQTGVSLGEPEDWQQVDQKGLLFLVLPERLIHLCRVLTSEKQRWGLNPGL